MLTLTLRVVVDSQFNFWFDVFAFIGHWELLVSWRV